MIMKRRGQAKILTERDQQTLRTSWTDPGDLDWPLAVTVLMRFSHSFSPRSFVEGRVPKCQAL